MESEQCGIPLWTTRLISHCAFKGRLILGNSNRIINVQVHTGGHVQFPAEKIKY